MALPVMQTPVYELTIPSTKKKVKYRPFLVKEEKALMIAQQSEDPKVMVDTLKQIIKACVQNVDVDKLALFDLEYIFLQLRAKSVGEISELVYSCLKCNDPKAKVNINLDITTIEVETNPEHKDTIDLFGDVGIKMKYPGFDMLNDMQNVNLDNPDDALKVIAKSIEFIFEGDKIHDAKEQSEAEMMNFLENLTREQLDKIKKFFDTMPKLKKEIEFDCPVCKYHHNYTVEGIQSFF